MANRVLVIGSGAIGLRTSKEFIDRGVDVILHSAQHPLHPSTCSMGAGGLWMPFHCDDERVHRWSMQTLDELINKYSKPERSSDNDVDHCDEEKRNKESIRPLVEILPAVLLKKKHSGPTIESIGENDGQTPEWTKDPRIRFQHLTVEMLWWQNIVHRMRIPSQRELVDAGYMHCWLFWTPIVDAPRMLDHLFRYVNKHAKDVKAGEESRYRSIDEMRDVARDLGCSAVVNCTGLGARDVVGIKSDRPYGAVGDNDCTSPSSPSHDEDLVGARGVLIQYDRKSCERRLNDSFVGEDGNKYDLTLTHDAVILVDEEPWGSDSMPSYLIPRGDLVVVGGSYLEHDDEQSIRDDERERLLRNAYNLGIDVDRSYVAGEWVGFRPYRDPCRCELDPRYEDKDIPVFHNYGFGGSGWTVNVGAAIECADVLQRKWR